MDENKNCILEMQISRLKTSSAFNFRSYGTRPVKENGRKPKMNATYKHQTEEQKWEEIAHKSVSIAKRPGVHGPEYHGSPRLQISSVHSR